MWQRGEWLVLHVFSEKEPDIFKKGRIKGRDIPTRRCEIRADINELRIE